MEGGFDNQTMAAGAVTASQLASNEGDALTAAHSNTADSERGGGRLSTPGPCRLGWAAQHAQTGPHEEAERGSVELVSWEDLLAEASSSRPEESDRGAAP